MHESIANGIINRIGGVTDSLQPSSVVDRGFQSKTIVLECVASPLSTQLRGERANTVWLGIRILCQSRATCPAADCCVSELAP